MLIFLVALIAEISQIGVAQMYTSFGVKIVSLWWDETTLLKLKYDGMLAEEGGTT